MNAQFNITCYGKTDGELEAIKNELQAVVHAHKLQPLHWRLIP